MRENGALYAAKNSRFTRLLRCFRRKLSPKVPEESQQYPPLVVSPTPALQLSKVYSDYGYDPAAGEVIAGSGNVQVTGSGNRVVYKRPAADAEPAGRWGR